MTNNRRKVFYMNFKRFLLLVLACTLPLSLFACENPSTPVTEGSESTATESNPTEQPPETDAPKVIETKTYSTLDIYDKIKPLGRTSISPDGIICDHVSSGIEFNAYIEGKLTVDITLVKSSHTDARNDNSYFTLYVDGVRNETIFENS